ncbi:MAG: hypothetical protein Fur0041_00430 [Bacteroidia bacterium]
MLFLSFQVKASSAPVSDQQYISDILQQELKNVQAGDTLVIDAAVVKEKDNKKLIAAILAFPLPFGVLGLHRIYLGTDPWVPVVYIATLGGGAGILPLIDFITILIQDEEGLKQYENNPHVFMWIN